MYMNRLFTQTTTAASPAGALLLLSIMMLTSVGTWAQDGEDPPVEGSGDSTTPTEVSVATAADLKSKLESETASTINMTESITLTEFVTAGATHTLSIAKDKTLTCTGEGGIGLSYNDNISLIIQGGENSKLECGETTNRSTITNGTLTLKNITVDITSGVFSPTNLTVGTGATINVDAADQDSPLQSSNLTVDNGGTININKFTRIGINIGYTLTINNGGTVKVGNGTGDNRGILISIGASIVLNGGTLEGTGEDKGGNIYLFQNAKVTGMSGKIVDQGKELNVSNGNEPVTVGAENAEPSTTSLTEGLYTWDGSSKFAKPNLKEGYTLSENGELTISSQIGMANWAKNGRGSNATKVKSVKITDDVTEIVEYAFAGCIQIPVSSEVTHTTFADWL